MKAKHKVFIKFKGREYELVGVKAMLKREGRSLVWADVDINVLLLEAALKKKKGEEVDKKIKAVLPELK